jgi:hypothetical protein
MAAPAPSKIRSSALFGVALTELFVLLLFLVIFLWIATIPAKTPSLNASYELLKQQLAQLQEENKKLTQRVSELERLIRERDAMLKLLWELYKKKPVPITLGPKEWEEFLRNWRKEAEKELKDKEAKQGAGAGRGHVNCLGKGVALRLVWLDDGIEVERGPWTDAHSAMIAMVPAIGKLVAAGKVTHAQFHTLGLQIRDWSENRQPKCRFDVTFLDKTTQKQPYRAAERAVDVAFYKAEIFK